MKKYIFMVLGLVMLAGAATFFYFSSTKIEIKKVNRILSESEQTSLDEGYYINNIRLNIELSKKIKDLDYFIIQNDVSKSTFNCVAELVEGNNYNLQFDNLYFAYVKYVIIGYSSNKQEAYFKSSADIEITDPYPIKVINFFINELVEVNDTEIEMDLTLYNPLNINISEIKYQINEDYKTVLKEKILIRQTNLAEFQEITLQIENSLVDSSKIELISIIIQYNDLLFEHIVKEDFSEVISVYKEVEVVDLITPQFVYLESKEFQISILIKENSDKQINCFTILVNDVEYQLEFEERFVLEEVNEYVLYIPNFKNVQELKILVINIIYGEDIYKVNELTKTVTVKRALDECVLKTKSSTVMSETKHTFYLECSYIDQKINLYKFNGKFNGVEFEGGNYISYSKDEQNKQDFGYIDVRNNIISLITLPVKKMPNQPFCSLEINEIIYFYDNQENVYVLNEVLWVIPEETVLLVKDFKMTKDQYNIPNELPMVKLELLVSPSIQIEKVTLEINGEKIETSFKDGGIKTPTGTVIFNCLAYRQSKDKDFVVNIHSIEYNGQGTKKKITGFTEHCSYQL